MAIGVAFVAAGGHEARAVLGNAVGRAYNMREVVDFAVAWLPHHRPGNGAAEP